MTKKRSTVTKQSPPPTSVPASEVTPFGRTFIVEDTTLTPESALPDDVSYFPQPHLSQEAASAIVFKNREVLFGEHTIGLLVQGKDTQYPFDALLFDLCIPDTPRLYLLAISTELTPMMLSLIALNRYLTNTANKEALLTDLTVRSAKDKRFTKAIGAYLTETRTLEVLLEQAVRKGLRGLAVFNTDDQQDAGIVTSYMGAHGGKIDVLFFRLYKVQKQTVLSMIPSFAELKAEVSKLPKEKVIHTEQDHLDKATELSRSIYSKLKAEALKLDKSLVVNPKGKHYISLRRDGSKNLAFFHFRKASIYLVVMLAEKDVRKLVKNAEVKRLPESVQSFWNGPSTGLVITSTEHLKEIVEVLKKLITQ